VAKYTQLTPDLARMALDRKVARELLIALEYAALAERTDAPYGEVRRAFAKLEAVGIELVLEDLIGNLLAERARSNRKRSKNSEIAAACHGTKESVTKIKIRQVKMKEEIEEEQKRTEENEFTRFLPVK
jgi:hypothetical protein